MMARLCECGCGQTTPAAKFSRTKGHMHGEPLRFVPGHQSRRPWSPERKARGQPKLRGRQRPEVVRQKISEHHKAAGIKPSAEAIRLSNANRGIREDHSCWKGGTTITNGYRCVYLPKHPRAHPNGYVYEHIVAAEKTLGRALQPGEVVHHEDSDKQNNDPENLIVFASQTQHLAHHRARGEAL